MCSLGFILKMWKSQIKNKFLQKMQNSYTDFSMKQLDDIYFHLW